MPPVALPLPLRGRSRRTVARRRPLMLWRRRRRALHLRGAARRPPLLRRLPLQGVRGSSQEQGGMLPGTPEEEAVGAAPGDA